MNKSTFAAIAVATVLIGAPLITSAQVNPLQDQITNLLSQIKTLQLKLADLLKLQTNVSTAVNIVAPAPAQHRICVLLSRNLSQGTSGDDVASLQEFLQSEGYFSANTSGYFGPITAQAVARWQAAQGLSTAGMFGPLSRERLKIWCGQSERFGASPQRGPAPLTVVFKTNVNLTNPAMVADAGDYKIVFGDGREYKLPCSSSTGTCQGPHVAEHTYASDGTYTATLVHYGYFGPPSAQGGMPETVVGKVQIQVGQIVCTKEYSPVCGQKQIYCITTPCNPIQQTYGNRCMAEADGAKIIYGGACRNDTGNPADDPRCKAWYDGCNSCSRQSPGSPAMCTLRACSAESMTKPYCTAYFDSTANKPPVISGFSGPTSLTLNEQGTWKIAASDPENGSLSYSVRWGDEWYGSDLAARSSAAPSIVQSTTFTHSYSTAGTYTVAVTVTDDSGQSAQSTATVVVGNSLVACTMEYNPVCGRPSGCANTCPPGMYCTMMCQMYDPVTYGNRCELNAANATYLHDGVCTAASKNQY